MDRRKRALLIARRSDREERAKWEKKLGFLGYDVVHVAKVTRRTCFDDYDLICCGGGWMAPKMAAELGLLRGFLNPRPREEPPDTVVDLASIRSAR